MHHNVSNPYPNATRLTPSVRGRPISTSMGLASPLSDHHPQVHYRPQQHAISTNQNTHLPVQQKPVYSGHMEQPSQGGFVYQQHGYPTHQSKRSLPDQTLPANNHPRHPYQVEADHSPSMSNQGPASPTMSQNLTSPTRRLDLSPNESPHSTIDSKKGRSRSSSQSTPCKSGFAIKRSDNAPVTLQGWLYKQGSDGLMLWKKRWFVLSEFCLFYYKGPDEDRCSGSILLPSYKISPVIKEDGVYRKFAFKAEHQNMRTYFFAAETKDSMSQWMNALSLASICQQEQNLKLNSVQNSRRQTVTQRDQLSPRPIQHQQQVALVQHHHPTAVHQMYSPSGDAYQYHAKHRHSVRLDSSEADDDPSSTRQPLYANAPPKPRRLNTSKDRDSPSPDRFVFQVNNNNNPTPLVTAMYQQPNSGVHRAHVIDDNSPQSYRQRPPHERRTPEVYGRASNYNPHQQYQYYPAQQTRPFDNFHNGNNFPDTHQQFQHAYPPPQMNYQHNQMSQTDLNLSYKTQNYPPQTQMYPNNLQYQKQPPPHHQHPYRQDPIESSGMQRHVDQIPRPHSADFLEYEKHLEPNSMEEIVIPHRGQSANTRHPNKIHYNQPPRPKSSIDQRIPSKTQYQTNEPNFIRLYPTTPQPRRSNFMTNDNLPQQYQQHVHHVSRNQNMIPLTPRPPPPPTANIRQSSALKDRQTNDSCSIFVENTNEEIQRYFPTPSPRKAPQATTMTYQNVPNSSPARRPHYRLESVTPSHLMHENTLDQNNMKLNEDRAGEFRRTSSARMHRNKHNPADLFNQKQFHHEESKKKEQQEESMKRLLEWKQRMLQSPLTRKSSRNASRTQTPTNSSSPVPSLTHDNFRHKILQELEQSGDSGQNANLTSSSGVQTQTDVQQVTRKGSGASRSSRNRTSPWVSNPQTSSSEEDGSDTKRLRKRSKSRQSNKSASVERPSDGPDYLNIERSVGDGREESQEQVSLDATWKRKAIGPDDCYNDDFSYGQMNLFHEDPLFQVQYGRMLDMRYRVQREQQQPTGPEANRVAHRKPMRREKTWHGDRFEEFQMLAKTGSQRERAGSDLKADKSTWSPVKAFEEIRKSKEAPPKNVVQHRLKQFESPSSPGDPEPQPNALVSPGPPQLPETNAEKRARFLRGEPESDPKIKIEERRLSQNNTTEKLRHFALKVDEVKVEEEHDHESRNFLDLLSDFERRTRELKIQEEDDQRAASKLHPDSRTERRVFSDTETMLYDSSSDDDSYIGKKTEAKVAGVTVAVSQPQPSVKTPAAPPLPQRLPETEDQYVPMAPAERKNVSESPYLAMTPPKVLSKKLATTLMTSSPRTSLTTNSSTSGSIRSLHSRTPSQTLVIEHLQKEIVAGILSDESYVQMREYPRVSTSSSEPWQRPESPRYCEIEDPIPRVSESEAGSMSSVPSHYEYLYQARTAPSQHYESVYQEIPEEIDLKRPMDKLPDILGNTPPVDAQTSSLSDVEEEATPMTPKPMMYDSDTFRPASFYLDNSGSGHRTTGARSKDSDQTLTKRHKSQSIDSIKSESSRGKESKEKTYKPMTGGLPADKINLMYRSVYDNETSSYSDTDQKTSAASSGSLNHDTDGSYINYTVSDLGSIKSDRASETPTPNCRPEAPSRTDFSYEHHPGVHRSMSLEGLLGDRPPGPRDSVQVMLTGPTRNTTPSSTPSYRSTPLPARGREPPPPPTNISTDLNHFQNWYPREDDDEVRWRESLRRASAEHKARSNSVCADPISDPGAFNARQNFLGRGLPDMTTLGKTHSGRPAQSSFPSLQNLAEKSSCSQSGKDNPGGAIYMNVTRDGIANPQLESQPLYSNSPMMDHQNFQPALGEKVNERLNSSDLQGESENVTDSNRQNGSFAASSKNPLNCQTQKIHENPNDLTAQDLLGKSREELVMMLVNLRRQSVTLHGAINASRIELQHLVTINGSNEFDESGCGDQKHHLIQYLFNHIEELEDKLSKVLPIISLVDNMVKLGSLYKNPKEDKHHSIESVTTLKEEDESHADLKMKHVIVEELDRVRGQLHMSKKKLNDVSNQHAHWENDILVLRQQLQSSASRDMLNGSGLSAETLGIESELTHVHHQANELNQRKTFLTKEIENLTQKQELLLSEIRPSPTGVSGAEPVPSRKKIWAAGWVETDLDLMVSIDRAGEDQSASILRSKNLAMYVNTYEEVEHSYENFQKLSSNAYEDDVQTVHSDGVRSEMEPPPLPSSKRPHLENIDRDHDDLMANLTLGDISEADDRVKKFFGILPKDSAKEIKTVRMVKRDSKERSISKVGNNFEIEDDDQDVESFIRGEPPPPPLPRGNYQNLHDFLTPSGRGYESLPRSTIGRIKYTDPDEDDKVPVRSSSVTKQTSTLPKTNFKLGEYYKRKYSKDSEKTSTNNISAHERLFGLSREASLSPPSSPEKSYNSSRVNSISPIISPIFKSAAARAIIQEVGKNWTGSAKKRDKKRSLTITGSHPAVMEAISDHQHRMLQGSARSRDDLDMEQVLRNRGQNTPDVIQSALDMNDTNSTTIDNLFGVPEKILIPERYVPELDLESQTPEERKVRLKKVDSIRRMLAEQTSGGETPLEGNKVVITEKRKQREQLLELNHLIARQVMEKTRFATGQSHHHRKEPSSGREE